MGIVAVAIKNNLDRYIATSFHRPWTLWSYWAPLAPSARIATLSRADTKFVATLVAIALPFIWLSVAMTVKRLRDAGQRVWLVGLFFIPVVNLLFFALLCVMPAKEEQRKEVRPWPGARPLGRWIPAIPTAARRLRFL